MEKTNRVLRNERSDVQITDIISQFVDMKKEDVLKVLEHRRKELREHAPFLYELLCDIDTFHNLKMDREREEIFANIVCWEQQLSLKAGAEKKKASPKGKNIWSVVYVSS